MFTKINKCRICGNENLVSVIDLGMQKLTGIFPKNGQNVNEGPLELVKCVQSGDKACCGLVQLRHSCSGEEMYGMNYGYRSGLNRDMEKHLNEIADRVEKYAGLKDGDIVLDIGSNDGTLLKSYRNQKLDLIGMDPTGAKFKQYYTDNIELIPDFFSAENFKKVRGGKKAKVVTSIAMFYDLEQPQKFVEDIKEILDEDGIWVLEQSYLPAMIETNSYDTICQEHLEFYCLAQIHWMVNNANMKVVDVCRNRINGGSFQIVVAHKESSYAITANVKEMEEWEKEHKYDTLLPFQEFESQVEQHKIQLLEFLTEKKKEGKKVLGYGASTKGNVLLQYCGITSDLITAIAEVNEDKYGCVTPGTGIPIISEKEAREMHPDYFVVLPWHFRSFILEKEEEYRKQSGCKFVFPLPFFEIV